MVNIFKKLFGQREEEIELPPIRIEKPVIKKNSEEIRREVYGKIADILYEEGVFSSHSGYDTYPRLKRSLQRINSVMDIEKEAMAPNERDLRELKEKILNYKEDKNVSMVSHDVCRLIIKQRHVEPSILNELAIGRILSWYGLDY